MKLKYLILFIFFSLYGYTQENDTISVQIKNTDSSRVILYRAEGAKQKYVSYSDGNDSIFKVSIPKDSQKGIYRLVYNQKTMDYIDFLYDGKEFNVLFDAKNVHELPKFSNSSNNTRYFNYLNKFNGIQTKIDSLQVRFFQEDDVNEQKNISKNYTDYFNKFKILLKEFQINEKNNLVKDLVLANLRNQPEKPIKNPTEYLPYIKQHYFDTIDFNNKYLIHSPLLVERAMDYIFYLTVAEDTDKQNELYKKSISDVLQLIDNQELKLGFIKSLIQTFAKEENIVLTDYLFDKFFDKLPDDIQDQKFKTAIQQDLKTAIGRKAQEISWKESDSIIKLSELKDYKNYILVFWSSTCPHCLKEVPKLYDYIKDNKDVKVIAIGLETEESKGNWKSESYYYPNFSHVLALGKWENPLVRSYNVYATPSYFILDENKIIVDKPYELENIKEFFKKENKQ